MSTQFKQVSDNALSITNTDLTSTGVTSLTLLGGTGSKFPSPGNGFYLTLWDNIKYFNSPGDDPNMEKVLCTARSTDVVTISATTKTHRFSGTAVALLDVSQNIIDLQSAVNTAESNISTNTTSITNEVSRAETSEALLAPKLSPTFTGTPTAPTASLSTNTTQLATTAFVQGVATADTPQATFTTSGIDKQIYYNVMNYGATGNGTTDDTIAIQNTINACNGNGIVYLPGGVYVISATLTIPSYTVLQGAGWSTELYLKNGVANSSIVYMLQNSNISGGNTGIIVRDIKLNNNIANNSDTSSKCIDLENVTQSHFENIWVTNHYSAFRIVETTYCKFVHNLIDAGVNSAGGSVAFACQNSTSHCTFSDNTVKNVSILVDLDSASGSCIYNVIADNTYDYSVGGSLAGDAILMVNGSAGAGSSYNTVTGNTIDTIFEDGIRVGIYASNNTVSNNVITSAGRYGISLSGNNLENTVTGNTINSSVSNGIFIDQSTTRNIVNQNTVTSSGGTGIYMNTSTFDNEVADNIVNGSALYSIYVLSTNGSNNVHGNKLNGLGVTQHGIYMLSTVRNIISNNIVKNHTNTGIRIQSAATNDTINNIIVGNRIFDDQSSKTQQNGIVEVSGSFVPNYNTYIGNDVYGNSQQSMTLQGTNNYILGNEGYTGVDTWLSTSGGNIFGNIQFDGTVNRLLSMNRLPTGTVGGAKSFSVQGSSAVQNSANANAGGLFFKSGNSTGSGTGVIQFQTSPATTNTLTALNSISVNPQGVGGSNPGSGYLVSDVLAITGGSGSSGTATVTSVAVSGQVSFIGTNNRGIGYVVGDVVTISGGGGTGATITITAVGELGDVQGTGTLVGGSGYTTGSNVATTGGTGTGLTLGINTYSTGAITGLSLTTAGTGYVYTTNAATTGGTGTGALLTIVPNSSVDNSSVTAMTILGNGNVGIGTTNPSTTLQIVGAIACSTTVNGLVLTSNTTGFSVAGGTTSKTLTVDNSIEMAGTDSTKMTFPSTNATIARTDAAQTFVGTQTIPTATITSVLNLNDGVNMTMGTTNGTKFGNNVSDKLGLWNATPIVQPAATTELIAALVSMGARASGSAVPITTTGAVSTGSLTLGTAGNKINITTGSNASAGTGTLSAGTVTISTTAVTANSLIFLQDTSNGANIGTLSVGTKTAATSFVVNSSNALDASTFNWFIIN